MIDKEEFTVIHTLHKRIPVTYKNKLKYTTTNLNGILL